MQTINYERKLSISIFHLNDYVFCSVDNAVDNEINV